MHQLQLHLQLTCFKDVSPGRDLLDFCNLNNERNKYFLMSRFPPGGSAEGTCSEEQSPAQSVGQGRQHATTAARLQPTQGHGCRTELAAAQCSRGLSQALAPWHPAGIAQLVSAAQVRHHNISALKYV